ncbi:MAG: DsbA family protein [Dehalococcoidia bacterium]
MLFVLGVVGVLVWLNRPGGSAGTGAYQLVARAQVSGRTWGDPNAPVRIIAFEDFQCPFCARHTRDVEPQLATEFIATGQVLYEYHHMAFLGEDSTRAAQAAECAVEQNQFWPFHDVLYQRQGQENSGVYSIDRLKIYGGEVDAALPPDAWDQKAFEGCLDSAKTRASVQNMTTEAGSVGVRSTPSFLVNGKLLVGGQSIEQFRQAIAQAKSATAP